MCFVHLRDFAHALAGKMGWKSFRLPFQDTLEPVAQCTQRFWQTAPQLPLQLRKPKEMCTLLFKMFQNLAEIWLKKHSVSSLTTGATCDLLDPEHGF